MKVREIYPSYTGLIDVGYYALFINVDKQGVEMPFETLLEKVQPFNNVVLFGEDTYKQKEDMASLVKKSITKNNNIMFHVHTNGMTRPISIGNFDNVKYYISLKMKRDGGYYEERVNPTFVSWFIKILGRFVFSIGNVDDVDEVNMIVQDMGIPKTQVFLTSTATTPELEYANTEFVLKEAKKFGYNIAPKVCTVMWPDEGKLKGEQDDENEEEC